MRRLSKLKVKKMPAAWSRNLTSWFLILIVQADHIPSATSSPNLSDFIKLRYSSSPSSESLLTYLWRRSFHCFCNQSPKSFQAYPSIVVIIESLRTGHKRPKSQSRLWKRTTFRIQRQRQRWMQRRRSSVARVYCISCLLSSIQLARW